MSTQSLPAQRVPAWKRLGLKLKGAAGETADHPISNAATTSNANDFGNSAGWGNKRKDPPLAASNFASKKPRTDFSQVTQTPGRRKSVTFADDTKGSDLDPSATKTPSKPYVASNGNDPNSIQPQQQKQRKTKPKNKSPKKPEQNFKPGHLQPQLSQYIRDWHAARDSWKFRKNIQTLLIKYAFDPELLPATDFPAFCKYASGLKGASRDWLRNSALELRKKDIEQKGAAGFPAGAKDVDSKQKQYEEVVSKMLGPQGALPRVEATNANGKRVRKVYSEEDFVMGGTEPEQQQQRDPEVTVRLVKRMRAELVLDELSDSDASTSTSTTTNTTAGGASAGVSSTEEVAEQKVNSTDGAQKRRRQRKKRTLGDEDDTSSSDESSDSSDDEDEEEEEEEEEEEGGDSGDESTSSSGTSSSGSDSGSGSGSDGSESEGALRRLQQEREALGTSSSSSSSSSSSGSDSEADSDRGDEL